MIHPLTVPAWAVERVAHPMCTVNNIWIYCTVRVSKDSLFVCLMHSGPAWHSYLLGMSDRDSGSGQTTLSSCFYDSIFAIPFLGCGQGSRPLQLMISFCSRHLLQHVEDTPNVAMGLYPLSPSEALSNAESFERYWSLYPLPNPRVNYQVYLLSIHCWRLSVTTLDILLFLSCLFIVWDSWGHWGRFCCSFGSPPHVILFNLH